MRSQGATFVYFDFFTPAFAGKARLRHSAAADLYAPRNVSRKRAADAMFGETHRAEMD
jgi:hypothetical protein